MALQHIVSAMRVVIEIYIHFGASVENSLHLTKILILNKKGVSKKSYERRAYESIDVIGAYFG